MNGTLEKLQKTEDEPKSAVEAAPVPAPLSAKASPVIDVRQAQLGYGRNMILRDVSVEIHQGEFWCLLGPNGEGKTTFIKALLGAIRPLRGKIFLRSDFASRKRLGFVPQECDLNPSVPTTVSEFINGGFVGLKLNAKTRDSRLRQILTMLGLQRMRERSFWELSGGQRQRCLIARALVRDPLLLMVDEPTAGLDLASAAGLLEIITDLSKNKGITVIFVTHDLGIAAQRASHVAMFKDGEVNAGPIADAFTAKNLEHTFGVPVEISMNGNNELSVVARPPSIHV